MSDEMAPDEQEFFDDLKREYMTREQKLEFIRKYNKGRRREEWEQTLNELQQAGYITDEGRRRLLGGFD